MSSQPSDAPQTDTPPKRPPRARRSPSPASGIWRCDCRDAGRPDLCRHALPGEVVEDTGEARITAPKIVTPSEDRVKAPCAHYRACGGCVLQHASEAFVARWKAEVVETALRGQGIEARASATLTSPARSRRRAVVTGGGARRRARWSASMRGPLIQSSRSLNASCSIPR